MGLLRDMRESRHRADVQEAYWRGITDLLEYTPIDRERAERLNAEFMAKAIPGLDDRVSTTDMKLSFIRKVFRALVE